jgi:hypothetical protein
MVSAPRHPLLEDATLLRSLNRPDEGSPRDHASAIADFSVVQPGIAGREKQPLSNS